MQNEHKSSWLTRGRISRQTYTEDKEELNKHCTEWENASHQDPTEKTADSQDNIALS